MRVRLILAALFFSACMSNQVVYHYADGSGNVYRLKGTTLSYDPVTPAESSTGTFSGGVPKTVSITSLQAEAIIRAIEKGMSTTAEQTETRAKGTGAITVVSGSKRRDCILKMNSQAKGDIEFLLKGYLQK